MRHAASSRSTVGCGVSAACWRCQGAAPVPGPRGIGKTMLARRLPSVLPPLEEDAALEVTRIHSVAGLIDPDHPLIGSPPFRAPHQCASTAAIVGGGAKLRPGEASLAHHGVLL